MVQIPSTVCRATQRIWVLPSAGDRKRDLREAPIGLAVPGKAFGQDRHPVHLPVPFSAQHGAGPEFYGTLTHVHGTLSGLLGKPRAIEQAYGLGVQVTQLVEIGRASCRER